MQGDREVDLGPVDGAAPCDLELVDDLLRLRLGAQRLGWTLQVREATPDLRELFALVGVVDLLEGQPSRWDGRPNSGNSSG